MCSCTKCTWWNLLCFHRCEGYGQGSWRGSGNFPGCARRHLNYLACLPNKREKEVRGRGDSKWDKVCSSSFSLRFVLFFVSVFYQTCLMGDFLWQYWRHTAFPQTVKVKCTFCSIANKCVQPLYEGVWQIYLLSVNNWMTLAAYMNIYLEMLHVCVPNTKTKHFLTLFFVTNLRQCRCSFTNATLKNVARWRASFQK